MNFAVQIVSQDEFRTWATTQGGAAP